MTCCMRRQVFGRDGTRIRAMKFQSNMEVTAMFNTTIRSSAATAAQLIENPEFRHLLIEGGGTG